MKKNISFILIMVLCMSLTLSVSATEGNVYTLDNVDVIFAEDSVFDVTAQQHIAHTMVDGDDGAVAYNLLCTLFGHNESTEYVETITHKAYPTAPRCYSQMWEITACTRCNEVISQRVLSDAYIFCCPED